MRPSIRVISSTALLVVSSAFLCGVSEASDWVARLDLKRANSTSDNQLPQTKDRSTTQALPNGDRYSLIPLAQDDEYYYVLSSAGGATTHTFDNEWETIGTNEYGTPGGKFLVIEKTNQIDSQTMRITVQVTAVDANTQEEPWVSEEHLGSGLTTLRLDVGSDAGGTNQIKPQVPYTLEKSGVWLYDSAGENVADIEIDDTSDADGLSGVAIVGFTSGGEIAGADIATMIMYWTIRIESNDTGFDVSSGQSGAWYDPSHNGEGFILQILNDTQAVVFWFTYDKNGRQQWMIGSDGVISGSRVRFDNLQTTSGGKFGPDFDPEDVKRTRWGTLELNFATCDQATATYSGPSGFDSGSLNVERLSSIWGMDCAGNNSISRGTGVGNLAPGFSGAWYDVSHNGEGFTLEILDETSALMYWFTYDTDGNQAWMMLLGEIGESTIFVPEVYQPSGPTFGPTFDPDDLILRNWGAAVFSFGTCTTSGHGGSMRYLPPSDFGVEGRQLLSRLLFIEGVDCRFLGSTYDISGTMTVAENIFIDGDVNDPNIDEIPNDLDPPAAQQLVPPARVAGFLTAEPTGESGQRFEDESDEWDIYVLALREGEGITLIISDWDPDEKERVDLDLYLVDVNDTENILASSLSADEQEMVSAPRSGNFFIFVNAYAGQSNYLLQSGQSGQTASSTLDISADFVPSQVMASVDTTYQLESTPEAKQKRDRIALTEDKFGLQRIRESADGNVLYEIDSLSIVSLAPHPLTLAGYGSITPEQWRVIRTSKALSANRDYQWAGPNYVSELHGVPNDAYYRHQWHYDSIRLPEAWDITRGSEAVVVAVLDTGVYDHVDLASNVNYALGYDFVRNLFWAADGDGLDSDARDPGKKYPLYDTYISHGTHVAGTIGARTNNSRGVAGVNWNVEIMPLRVCGVEKSSCDCWSQTQALRWAGRLSNESGSRPAKKADIVNMSLGGSARCIPRETAINQLTESGIIVIASAGNEGNSIPQYPASLANVISVSATTLTDSLAYYSSYGSTVDIAAPGGDVTKDRNNDSFPDGVLSNLAYIEKGSANVQEDYYFLQGTSMAAPHVTGIAALMKSVYPVLGPTQFRTALTSGKITIDLAQNGETTKDTKFGYGRIDAYKAVKWAVEADQGQETEAFMTSSVAALDFGSDLQSIDFIIEKSGTGSLTVSDVGWSENWMSASRVSVDQAGFGRYRVIIDRDQLIDGQYTAWLVFDASNGSRLWVSVLMRVGESVSGEAGHVYALLLDQWTLGNVKWQERSQAGDSFNFNLQNLPSGTYYLVVGTDLDKDYSICDDGELCELYPGGSLVNPIVIDRSDFNLTAFRMGFPIPELKSAGQSSNALINSMEEGDFSSKPMGRFEVALPRQ